MRIFTLSLLAAIFLAFLSPATAISYSETVLENNPVVYWRLGESLGTTTAVDSGSSGTDATYVGSPQLGFPGALPGDADTAIKITDASTHVTAPGFTLGTEYSASVWINSNSFADHSRHYIFDMRNGGGAWFFIDRTANSSVGEINVRGASVGGDSLFFPTATLADGEWHHLAFTTSVSVGTILYLDGAQIASSGSLAATGFSAGGRIGGFIGSGPSDADHWFDGALDELAMYNTALSAEQVLAQFNSAPNSTGVIPEPTSIALLILGFVFCNLKSRH